MSFLSLLSTVAYNQDGTAAPNGYINTVSSSKPLFSSTIVGSGITMSSLSLTTSSLALGFSTTQSQTNFSNGSYAPASWLTAKSGMTNVRKLGTSSTGQYQLIVSGATSDLYLSSDSGITWSALSPATTGLPTLTGSAYWSSGSISANGQYILLGIYGGSLWFSQDFGRTFALTAQATPNIWLQLNGNVTDSMGGPAATATGSPAYITVQHPGYSDQVIHLANTAGGTATRYVRGSWAGAPNFTVSFWFNAQTFSGSYNMLFNTYSDGVRVFVDNTTTNRIVYSFSNSATGGTTQTTIATSYAITTNTWYYVTFIFQTNGVCSLYVNNSLIGTGTNSGGISPSYPSSGLYALGTYDTTTALAFNGYLADLRILNSAPAYVPLPHLQPNLWLPMENNTNNLGSQADADPLINLRFEGNTTDSKSFSTITPTGSFTYVGPARPGVTGSQAIVLANTAGGTATNYVRGTWTLPSPLNFTVSLWMNPQTLNSTTQPVFVVSGAFSIYINTSNYITAQIPSGGGTTVVTSSWTQVPTVGTWYHITVIFQTGGLCSFYVNGILINSFTNSSGFGTFAPTGLFGLGTNDNNTNNAFNGYLDDLRIFNSAVTYSPAGFVTGSVSYVPGVVGLNAVNLVNTAGGAATNYIISPISQSGITNITVSVWFNIQSISTSSASTIVGLGGLTTGTYLGIYTTTSGGLIMSYLNPSSVSVTIGSVSSISLNTWYHAYLIFQQTSTCFAYLNGTSIGSVAGGALFGNNPIYDYALGRNVGNNAVAFNGYIDDLRIYNAAIPIHLLNIPQNYRSVALSGTGQYALASAASGWVVGSTTTGQTWEKEAVCVGTQGDLIQPNKTGLGANAWEQAGVNWVTSASSVGVAGDEPYKLFDNNGIAGVIGTRWVSTATVYSAASPGLYTGAASTTIVGVGSILGEWVQIQSTVSALLSSFSPYPRGYQQFPKDYYIVGSNDGSTWNPIQYGVFATNPNGTTDYTIPSTAILINLNGAQTFVTSAGSTTLTTTTYATTTTPYLYFRLIVPRIFNGIASVQGVSFQELILNFARQTPASHPTALSLSYSGQYQLVAANSAAGNVMPNQSGLVSNTWVQGGVTWGATASSQFDFNHPPYKLFDNNISIGSINRWASLSTVYNLTTGLYTGSISTTIQGIGSIGGEWVQIQSSVPLVLSSYAYAVGVNIAQMPKVYYIVGSMDGSTWFPLQLADMVTTPFTTGGSLCSFIQINQTGTQTPSAGQTGSITTTSYSQSTQAYLYFRLVINTVRSANTGAAEIGEWYLNFQNSVSYSSNYGATWLNSSRTLSNESVALSPSGQYALSTNSVPPLARLTLDNTAVDAQGILTPATGAGTVTYSTSIVKVGTHSAFFNNTAGAAPTVYLNYTVPSVLFKPIPFTISCWVYPISLANDSCPWMFTNSGLVTAGPNLFLSSNGNVSVNMWTINGNSQIPGGTQNIVNRWTHFAVTLSGNSGVLYMNGIQIGSNNSVAGPLSTNGGGDIGNFLVGTGFSNYLAFAGYVDDVRLYTTALSADEVLSLYRNPALTQSIGVSNSYLPITSYSEPILPNISANVVDAKVSQTGQYMVAVTSATSNNVYYSIDFGATFNALTIGSSPMTACSISHDGSYLTVSNATTAYTLNRNATGYTLALGNQAGQLNQAQNAIAIGNQAGQLNQSANSIILNASGSALNSTAPGFYVAPIADTAGLPMNLLGYGEDQQVVKSGVTVLPGGYVGIGTTNPLTISNMNIWRNISISDITNSNPMPGQLILTTASDFARLILGTARTSGVNALSYIQSSEYYLNTDNFTQLLLNPRGGNVGIGTTNPVARLQVFNTGGNCTISCRNSTNVGSGLELVMEINSNKGFLIQRENADLGFRTNNVERMLITSSGTVFLSAYTANGTVTTINSNGQLSVSSDRRIKENIYYLSDTQQGLSHILNLRPAMYNLIGSSDTYLGFIAQDLEVEIPLAVDGKKYEWQWEVDENGKPKCDADGNIVYKLDADGNRIIRPRGVQDRAIIATQTLAIQELAKRNDSLQADLATTQAQLATTQAELATTQADLATTQAQLATTQSQLASTQSQLASLLAWAHAQGFSG